MNCQYHPAIDDWPTANLISHICPECGEKANLNESMVKRLIESRKKK